MLRLPAIVFSATLYIVGSEAQRVAQGTSFILTNFDYQAIAAAQQADYWVLGDSAAGGSDNDGSFLSLDIGNGAASGFAELLNGLPIEYVLLSKLLNSGDVTQRACIALIFPGQL